MVDDSICKKKNSDKMLNNIFYNFVQIRVDFVDTEMLSPVEGNCDDQYMTVSGSIWPTGFKRICGINPG